MNQPLDNFFREKLERVHKPAPSAAWDRIDAGLEGRQRKSLWLKIAASALIVAAGSFILWPREQGADRMHIVERSHKTPLPQSSPEQRGQEPTSAPAPSSPAVAMTPPSAIKPQLKKQRQATPHKENAPVLSYPDQQPVAYETHEAPQTSMQPSPIHDPATAVQPVPTSADVVLAQAETEEETDRAVTLVYTADEINEKYLDKEALEKATSAQKKPSTFRKLLEKAYDLKNNQDPMGGLRQKKNEILALNFKSEKRSQNK